MHPQSAPQTRSGTALLVGTDEMLLYTRKAILEKQGFAVSIVEPVHAVDHLDASDYDVVVACHTITPEEADSLVQAARARPVQPALIGFSREVVPAPTSHPFDVSVWSFASPEAFISKVHEALETRQS